MYNRDNPFFDLLNPLASLQFKGNAFQPMPSMDLINQLSNRETIERLYQSRLNLEAQVLGLQNEIAKMQKQLDEKKSLISKKEEAIANSVESEPSKEEKTQAGKRKRRKARDVERSHMCPVPNCKKSYGSGASLYLHVRLKHLPSDMEYYKASCLKNKKSGDENLGETTN